MPHGGGHHGGGFHHGGGGGWGHHHHHGGWGGHHHHHHRHHYGRHWGWGWGSYGYGGYYRYHRGRFYRGWGFGIGCFVAVTLIIVLSISLSIRYNNNGQDDNMFAPGDTRIISFSSSFCEGLKLSGDDRAKLYLLQEKPPLSGPNRTLHVEAPSVIQSDMYHDLYYYLHRNSEVSMTYCLESGSSTALSFAFIKGQSNFNRWKNEGGSSHTVRYFDIKNYCSSSGSKEFSYTVTSGDTYYFAFDNTAFSNSVKVRAKIELNRTEYLPGEVGIRDSCSINGDSCSVSVPYNSDYVAVLEVSSVGIESDENVAFYWSCDARAWTYVLIVLFPLLFVIITLSIVLAVCVYYARKRSKNYTTLPTETPAEAAVVDTTVTTTTTTTATAPPPMNPNYNPAPPGYGATGELPPPYPINEPKL